MVVIYTYTLPFYPNPTWSSYYAFGSEIQEYFMRFYNEHNLKEYVGPPVYHRDRLYVKPPPPGVSTGLGYLGNGSGAVMPIEATVRAATSA